MSTDRLLATVLQAYQNPQDLVQANRILSTTTSLLTTLSNPLNITILTSQLLIAPAVWSQVDGLRSSLRILGVFNSAAITVTQRQLDRSHNSMPSGGVIPSDEWARAIIQGADDRSPRWRHLLVIGGILLGMEGQGRRGLSTALRTTLERALVVAANMALEEQDTILGIESVIMALTHCFDLLSDTVKTGLNYDALAPIMMRSMISAEGYQEGYFLDAINDDIILVTGNKLNWSPNSSSFLQLQEVASKPLINSVGPLSRLTAHALGHLTNSRRIPGLLDDLLAFSAIISKQWRVTKFSELDPSRDTTFLSPETARVTFPVLWQVLKTLMFATINILRSVIGRTLVDPVLATDTIAVTLAAKTLHILRNIYFISSRLGSNTFTAYTFTFLTSIDILSHFPSESRNFLTQIRPTHAGQIPSHPADQNLDLYFLNTCEHFTLALSPQDNELLIVAAASPYLDPAAHRSLVENFEAAHSAMLASLAAPQNAEMTARIIPFYVDALFASFPTNLSPRQFRFAFKMLLQITAPPAPLSASQPLLPDTLLEMLHHRAMLASTEPLPQELVLKGDADTKATGSLPPLSEQAILMLTLVDALPFLPYHSLEEWLPLSAELLNMIDDSTMRETCKARFWEVLESGEMDVDRAAICVAWWSTRGGRELVLYGRERHFESKGPFMSGGLSTPRDGSRL